MLIFLKGSKPCFNNNHKIWSIISFPSGLNLIILGIKELCSSYNIGMVSILELLTLPLIILVGQMIVLLSQIVDEESKTSNQFMRNLIEQNENTVRDLGVKLAEVQMVRKRITLYCE